jgi:hypothetical protein
MGCGYVAIDVQLLVSLLNGEDHIDFLRLEGALEILRKALKARDQSQLLWIYIIIIMYTYIYWHRNRSHNSAVYMVASTLQAVVIWVLSQQFHQLQITVRYAKHFCLAVCVFLLLDGPSYRPKITCDANKWFSCELFVGPFSVIDDSLNSAPFYLMIVTCRLLAPKFI